eukprot:TRINITY_DN4778_c0_g1_i1.p1 TRINITY_DN4778_c0_g1~~TRINITY_DN4778_c0_g1_i1.p1  ORF type:complete len:500 (-),score=139.41 TRINITY_DN4778_c0_g1_i1:300-1799(-)
MVLKLTNADFFKKIPEELKILKGTKFGGALTIAGFFLLALLVILETKSYLIPDTSNKVVFEDLGGENIRLEFDALFHELPCQFIQIDVEDVLGSHKINVTKSIEKWRIDPGTIQHEKPRRLAKSEEIKTPEFDENIPEEHSDHHGKAIAPALNPDNWEHFIKQHDVTLVAFMATWCHWCKRLSPIWEASAGAANKKFGDRVTLAKVECADPANKELCGQHHIQGYPTIVLYTNGLTHSHQQYQGPRSVEAFLNVIERQLKKLKPAAENKRRLLEDEKKKPEVANPPKAVDELKKDKHEENLMAVKTGMKEGCEVSGYVDVKRVPGTLFMTLDSESHSFDHSSVNVTHFFRSLNFVEPDVRRRLHEIPSELSIGRNKLLNEDFVSNDAKTTHQHYLKGLAVSRPTNDRFEDEDRSPMRHAYKYSSTSHSYVSEDIPMVKLQYDFSPVSVMISQDDKMPFYHFITNLCAIIGGVFTVLGLLDAVIYQGVKMREKIALGKAT